MPHIKFYFAPGACSLAPHILLKEIGAQFEAISNEVTVTGATFTEDFPRINPKMRVPVISLDEETITEVPAVTTVIAQLAPGMHLMGRTPLDTVRVYEWMSWLGGTLHGQGFGGLIRPGRLTDDPAAFDGINAKAVKNIKDCYNLIEEMLVGMYAVGGAFTAVDAYLFVIYRWGNGAGFKMREEYPKYTALVSNLVQRPAVIAALKAEDITSTL
jgi:glutathione S-transferase